MRSGYYWVRWADIEEGDADLYIALYSEPDNYWQVVGSDEIYENDQLVVIQRVHGQEEE